MREVSNSKELYLICADPISWNGNIHPTTCLVALRWLDVPKDPSNQNSPSKIAKFRKAAGLTQLELANRLDVTEATIANWESGRSRGVEWIGNVVLLCDTLKCDLPDLLEQDLFTLRKKAGLTQRSLAKVFGVRENTIATWEKDWHSEGNAYKRVQLVARLCEALGRQPSELVSKKPERTPTHIPLPPDILIRELKKVGSQLDGADQGDATTGIQGSEAET